MRRKVILAHPLWATSLEYQEMPTLMILVSLVTIGTPSNSQQLITLPSVVNYKTSLNLFMLLIALKDQFSKWAVQQLPKLSLQISYLITSGTFSNSFRWNHLSWSMPVNLTLKMVQKPKMPGLEVWSSKVQLNSGTSLVKFTGLISQRLLLVATGESQLTSATWLCLRPVISSLTIITGLPGTSSTITSNISPCNATQLMATVKLQPQDVLTWKTAQEMVLARLMGNANVTSDGRELTARCQRFNLPVVMTTDCTITDQNTTVLPNKAAIFLN